MTQLMAHCQRQQKRDTILPDGGQQRVVELKSHLPQKSQLHRIIPYMLIGHQINTQSHSIQMVEQFLQRQKLSHMTQPMGRCQHQQELDILLPVGGQQQAMGHKSPLQQKLQSQQHKHSMLIGLQTKLQLLSIKMVVLAGQTNSIIIME